MFHNMKQMLKTCIVTVLISYGVVYLCAELFLRSLPYGFLTALVMYFAICLLRIPQPLPYQAEAIVGEDLWCESEEADESAFYLKTVAHRGAGLDAPENSLEAFKLVFLFCLF